MNTYQSESIDQLITALAKAQGEMSSASKDSKGYNYKYADLASVWEACRGPLSHNGLAITQIETQNETGDILVTILGHSSGQWIRSIMPIRVKQSSGKTNELQEMGSVLTYLRRYSLSAIVGVAPAEDDDGVTASSYVAGNNSMNVNGAKSKLISNQQLELLTSTLNLCSPGFRKRLDDFMAKNNFLSFSHLDLNQFQKIMTEAKLDINQSKIEASNGQVAVN
jgi:predicted aconitase